MEDSDNSSQNDKELKIFGRNIAEIPCFRTSFMYGIWSGIGTGLAYFMFTSRTNRASDIAIGTFIGVTFLRWCICRYNWSEQKFKHQQIRAAINASLLLEGTEEEKKLMDNNNSKNDK